MSQQINLLNPAFRKTRDWLSATPLAAFTLLLLLLIAAAAYAARVTADAQEKRTLEQEAKLKTTQEQLLSLSKEVAEKKPDPRLQADLTNLQGQQKTREEIVAYLSSGNLGSSSGFAEYLRGFARQVTPDLWLTGFALGAGGNEMEIHGRMLNAEALPEYIRRLNREPAFHGRSFAALTIVRPGQEKQPAGGAALPTRYVEFVLTPSLASASPANAEKKP